MTYQVRAKVDGLYDGHRTQNEVFPLNAEEDFAPAWMEPVGWAPKPTATPTQTSAPKPTGGK